MRKLKLLTYILVLAILILGLFGGCTTPAEQEEEEEEEEPEPIELMYASTYGPDHPFTLADYQWMDRIVDETGGRVEFTLFLSGTLITPAEALNQIIAGVTDIGVGTIGTGPEFVILKGMNIFSYGVPSTEDRRELFNTLRDEFPEIDEEWSDVKVLGIGSGVTFHLVSTTPVRTIEDFNGLTIKCTTGVAPFIEGLGADPIVMPMSEVYVNLQKGIIDGALTPYETLVSMRLAEVAKYVTHLHITGMHYQNGFMNWDTWNSLPADIQEVFDDLIDWRGELLEDELLAKDAEGYQFGVEEGVEFIDLPEDDLDQVYAILELACISIAEGMDAQGVPGTEILTETRRLAEQYA